MTTKITHIGVIIFALPFSELTLFTEVETSKEITTKATKLKVSN